MKYRNQGISPDHTMTIHLTEKEKEFLKKCQKQIIKTNDRYVSFGEMVRIAIIEKINKLDLKHKKLKEKDRKPVRISITATNELFRNIKLATQESKESSISDFMRNAIFEYYKSN
jgi:hypothetical protein